MRSPFNPTGCHTGSLWDRAIANDLLTALLECRRREVQKRSYTTSKGYTRVDDARTEAPLEIGAPTRKPLDRTSVQALVGAAV